ncbi:MAG TPA: hypothetical protein VJT74_09340 [Pyrinomonadaceae bacterium]|nr:hypothetical protein [Pyrinomonadaceae bacterium]
MMKIVTTLLHVCFALLVGAAGCGGKSSVNGNATVVTNSTQSSRESQPTPSSSTAATASVRLKQVLVNADLIDAPVEGAPVTLKAGDKSFSKMTARDGSVLFDAVPCGGDVTITARADESDKDTTLRRKLDCGAGTVDLGLIVSAFGGPPALEQREAHEIVYDATAGVWRAGDRIVPDTEVEKILSKYQSGGR